MRLIAGIAVCLLIFLGRNAYASEYHIGVGQTYQTIGSAPWSSLVAGDTVYIHAKPNQSPYYEHLYISAKLQGTPETPISIVGVSAVDGHAPILDGTDCTTGVNFDDYGSAQYHSDLGVVVFGPSGSGGASSFPSWVTVSNIKVQNYKNTTTTDKLGNIRSNISGCGVYIQGGEHIVLDGLTITNTTDGIFGKDLAASGGPSVQHITVKNSNIYGNGVSGNYLYHNTYTEVKYLVFEYNTFGPLTSGAPGNNIKDRGTGTVIRYNWIDGGQHLLDIVQCQDNCVDHTADPAWDDTFVYGNTFIAGPGAASQLFHLGSDDAGWNTDYWRKNLYFYHNTVHVIRDKSYQYYVNIFQLSSAGQTVYAHNNIIYLSPSTDGAEASELYLQYDGSVTPSAYGNIVLGQNWISPGWLSTKPGITLSGSHTGESNIISPIDNNPAFVDAVNQNYRLSVSSGAVGSAGSLPQIISTGNWMTTDLTPSEQYPPLLSRASISDLGAYMFDGVVPVVPGICGSSNGLALSSAPVTSLCTAGTPSAVTGTGPFLWTCAGSGGGSTANCGATLLEVPPTGNASALVACPVIAGFR